MVLGPVNPKHELLHDVVKAGPGLWRCVRCGLVGQRNEMGQVACNQQELNHARKV